MSMSIGDGEGGSYADINMTPLIDVMLVLLIIFILTIPIQTNAVKIDNPNGKPPLADQRTEVVDLSVDFDGTLSWNQVRVDRAHLQSYIAQEAARSPQPEVHLTVDRYSRYEVVAQTLADLQRRGLKKIGFVNDQLF